MAVDGNVAEADIPAYNMGVTVIVDEAVSESFFKVYLFSIGSCLHLDGRLHPTVSVCGGIHYCLLRRRAAHEERENDQ